MQHNNKYAAGSSLSVNKNHKVTGRVKLNNKELQVGLVNPTITEPYSEALSDITIVARITVLCQTKNRTVAVSSAK